MYTLKINLKAFFEKQKKCNSKKNSCPQPLYHLQQHKTEHITTQIQYVSTTPSIHRIQKQYRLLH